MKIKREPVNKFVLTSNHTQTMLNAFHFMGRYINIPRAYTYTTGWFNSHSVRHPYMYTNTRIR
jgi:hypothetical protein